MREEEGRERPPCRISYKYCCLAPYVDTSTADSMWESLGLLPARISKGQIRDMEFKRETNEMNRENRSELVTSGE